MVASLHIEVLLQHHHVEYWKNIASHTNGVWIDFDCHKSHLSSLSTQNICHETLSLHCTFHFLFKLSIEPPISPLLIQECPFDIHYRVPVNKGSMKKREKTSNACDK
eukprot:836128_1